MKKLTTEKEVEALLNMIKAQITSALKANRTITVKLEHFENEITVDSGVSLKGNVRDEIIIRID